MNYSKIITETAGKILAENPSTIVCYLLLRDVIGLSANNNELIFAKQNLSNSQCVRELAEEQLYDGGGGNFHGMHSHRKQKTPTTEVGVMRAVALGLDSSHPILVKASKYIVNILESKIPFPDWAEKNDRWDTGKQLFLASTLSLINPSHPILKKIRKLWLSIAQCTFKSGRYSEDAEISIHKRLTGATVKDSYLILNSKYHLILLSSIQNYLPEKLEDRYIRWIWRSRQGIGYLEIPLSDPPPYDKSYPFDR